MRLSPIPLINLSVVRRLFPKSSIRGGITLNLAPRRIPVIGLTLSKPLSIRPNQRIGTGWTIGPNFQLGIEGPSFLAEYAIFIRDLALQLKANLGLTIGGPSVSFIGQWVSLDQKTSVVSSVVLSRTGVMMTMA